MAFFQLMRLAPIVAALTVFLPSSSAFGLSGASHDPVKLAAVEQPQIVPLTITAASSLHVLQFTAAPIGSGAQSLTATFTVSGYSGSFTPTAVMHYGRDYTLGTVSCTPGGGDETCSVDVTFAPTLPGGCKDAIFLMNGATRIGTLLVYGIGLGPLSAVEPGVVTQATQLPFSNYYYGSTIDENGIIYATTNMANTLYRIAKDGTATTITLNGPIADYMVRTLAIDGAGVLYLGGFSSSIITYDTTLGTMGSIPVPWITYPNDFQESITIDAVGDLFSIELAPNNGTIEELKADGTAVSTTLNPELLLPNQITTEAAGNVFVGGYYTNELTTGGVQTQINRLGSFEGVAVDASETVYVTRYSGTNNNRGVAELPPSNYSTANGFLDTTDTTGDPLGLGLGSDGTLAIGVYQDMDIVDRSQGSLDFQNAAIGATTSLTADIRNIGNQPLTISDISITGDGYVLATGSGDCAANLVLAPAEICNITVSLTPTHAGTQSGEVTVTSDSLTATTTQTIALTGKISGAYLVASSVPVNFGNQEKGTSSSAQAVNLTNSGADYDARITAITSSDPAFTVAPGNCEAQNVALGSSCQMSVTFSPTAITHYSGTVTVTYFNAGVNSPAATATFAVAGDGSGPPTPVVSLAPTTLAFGNQYVGFPSTVQTATLSNTGNGPLTLTSIVLGGANAGSFAETTTCGGTLAAGSSCQISATLTAVTTGALVATITITDNAGGSPHLVMLTGTGVAVPVATLTPSSLNFGSQLEGSSSAVKTLTLSNPSSTTALNFDAVAISGAGSASFSQTNNCGATIAASGSCTISVSFTPASAASLSATLAVTTRYPSFGPVTVSSTLAGTGVAPPTPTFTPATLAFGNQVVGTSSARFTTTLTNTGTDTLVIDGLGPVILGTGASSLTAATFCGGTLAPGGTCPLSATFTPATLGAYALSIRLSAHYASAPGVEVYPTANVTGTGIAPPTPTFTPSTLAFGNQIVGINSAPLTTTLTNTGTDNLVIEAYARSATLSVDNNCPATLTPGGKCTLTVTFTPSAVGASSLTLQIQAHYASSPSIELHPAVNVTGAGIAVPVPTLAPASLDFGNQTVDTVSAAKTVTITNPATIPLIVDSIGLSTFSNDLETNNCGGTIAAGASCQAQVSFAPTTAAPLPGDFGLEYHYGSLAPLFVSVKTFGTGIAPAVPTVTPVSLGFTSQTVYTTSGAKIITLANSAAIPLLIDSIALSDTVNFHESTTCGATLAAGSSCGISIAFTPTQPEAFNSLLTLQYHFTVRSVPQVTIPLEGVGVAPPAPAATPASIAFGNQIVHLTSSPQSIALSMPSTAGRHIDAITFAGANASSFSETNTCPVDVPANTSCQISVSLTPAAATAMSATLQITDEIGGEPGTKATQTVALAGTGVPVPPQPGLSPSSLDFGSQVRGAVGTPQTVTLKNSGAVPLLIDSIALADTINYSATNTCSAALAAGASCQISVTFTPSAFTTITSTLTVTTHFSGLSPTTQTVALTGTSIRPPPLAFTPGSLDFGSVALTSSSAPQTLTLTNPAAADQPITIDSIVLRDTTEFIETNNCPATLAAGASCQIQVTFTPDNRGLFSAILRVNYLSPAYAAVGDIEVSTTVTGTGAAAPVPTFAPASLDFGSQPVGSASTPQTVTLSNPSASGLAIALLGFTGGGFNQTNNCPATLPAGASCQVQVTFAPGSVGAISGDLRLSYLYPGFSPAGSAVILANLSGTGTPAPAPAVSLSTTSLDFGNQIAGSTSAAKQITVTNVGNASLFFTSISIPDGSPGIFAETNTCGSNLPAGASCTISLTFAPTNTTAYSASLQLVDDDSASNSQIIALTGTGIAAPPLVLDLSAIGAVVSSGDSTMVTVKVGAMNGGYHNAVALSVSGLPAGATAAFVPASIPAGSDTGSSVLTIKTAVTAASANDPPPLWPLGVPTLAICLFALPRRFRKQWRQRLLLGVLALLSLGAGMSLSGCDGSTVLPSTVSIVTITATSGSEVQTTTFTLTVK